MTGFRVGLLLMSVLQVACLGAPAPLLQWPDMVAVPAGRFTMGAAPGEEGATREQQPQHAVTVSAFSIGRNLVTFAEWDRCVADGGCNGYRPADEGWGRGNRPVVNVSWRDAQAYIAWLNGKVLGRLSTGSGDGPFRLPTEAEWEYAARAGTTSRFYWGDDTDAVKAVCATCGDGTAADGTAPVGSQPPNPWGINDIAGNAWEWMADCWNPSYDGAPPDARSWTLGNCRKHPLRGGSWRDPVEFLTSAYRGEAASTDRFGNIGFRLAQAK